VRTAVPLDDELRSKLAKALSSATGKDVDVKVIVDESIVGGIYAKVGDQVIDATIRNRLQELREQLAKRG
jgi:F-type H+-transporting ATPase subunit delta